MSSFLNKIKEYGKDYQRDPSNSRQTEQLHEKIGRVIDSIEKYVEQMGPTEDSRLASEVEEDISHNHQI